MLVILSMDLESRCNFVATFQYLVLAKLITDVIFLDLTGQYTAETSPYRPFAY